MTFNALIITVRQPVVDQIRCWQQDVNLQLMAGRLARSGTIDVQRLGSTHDFLEIDYLPKRGEAEPLLTDFGGLYAYRFRYAEHSWRLTISAAVSPFTVARLEPVPPLDVELPGSVLEVAAVELPHPDQWRDPQISNGATSFYEVSGDELTFPIEGKMYAKLGAWGWDRLQPEAYEYFFQILSVGCELGVTHLPSGRWIHLTEDVGW